MTNPIDWTATEALAAIKAGRISAREYAEALLAQCRKCSDLNAFIHLDGDAVLAAVDANSGGSGRLAGFPVPLKDNFNTADMPTTGGTPGLRNNRPRRNAAVVQRLVEEGAVVMGKLNLHELAFGITNNNAAFGPVSGDILGDIPNYTDLSPVLQISEVLINASRSETEELRAHS